MGLPEQAARVDGGSVCTIHRFALTLLQRYPLAAGLPPEPMVLDETEAETLRRAVLAESLRHAHAAETRALLDECLGPGLGLSARGRSDAETPSGRLEQLVASLLEKSASLGASPEAMLAHAEPAARDVAALLGPVGDPAALEDALETSLQKAFLYLDGHPEPDKKTDHGLYAALRALQATERASPVDTALRLDREECSKSLAKVIGPLTDHAAALARDHPTVRARIDRCVRGVFAVAARVLARYAEERIRPRRSGF